MWQAILLGIIQGATEFLPVSSSGHLVLVPYWLGWDPPGLTFTVAVHLGTLVAVFLYFWRDWLRVFRGAIKLLRSWNLDDPDSRLFVFLIIGSIPAGVIGLLFNDFFEKAFNNPEVVAVFLLVTAGVLIFSERQGEKATQDVDEMTWQDSVFIGLAQLLALFPGVSRSGSTIAAGLFRGITRIEAARFSFLLGTFAILGAGLLAGLDLLNTDNLSSQLPILLGGFVSAAVVGYLAIAFLLTYLRERKLYIFAGYCAIVGLVSLLAALLSR